MARLSLVLALLLALLLLHGAAAHAAAVTWTNGGGDGLFESNANWSSGTVPGINDDVFFDATSNANCTIGASHTIKSIHQSSHTGTVTFGTGTTITTTDVNTFSVLASGTWTINGTLSLTNNNQTSFNGGTVVINGTLEVFSPLFTVNTSLDGTGTFKVHANLSFGAPLYVSTGSWSLQMVGGAQTLFMWSGNNLNRLIIGATSTTTLSNGPPQPAYVKVDGDVTVQAGGRLDLSAGAVTVVIGGNLSLANSSSLNGGGSSTIVFDGAGAHAATTANCTLSTLAITGGGTVTLQDPLAVSQGLQIASGTLDPGTNSIVLAGNFTVGGPGTFRPASGQTTTFASTGTISISAAGSAPFRNLTIQAPGTVTVAGEVLYVNETLSLSGGSQTSVLDIDAPLAVIGTTNVGASGRIHWARAAATLTLGNTDVRSGGEMQLLAAGGHLNLNSGATLHVLSGGRVTMTGTSAASLFLRCTSAGMTWNLVDDSAPSAAFGSLIGSGLSGSNPTYVDVSGSVASGTAAPIRPGGSIDSGGNVNWVFGAPAQTPDAGPTLGGQDPTSPYACAVGVGGRPGSAAAALVLLTMLVVVTARARSASGTPGCPRTGTPRPSGLPSSSARSSPSGSCRPCPSAGSSCRRRSASAA